MNVGCNSYSLEQIITIKVQERPHKCKGKAGDNRFFVLHLLCELGEATAAVVGTSEITFQVIVEGQDERAPPCVQTSFRRCERGMI